MPVTKIKLVGYPGELLCKILKSIHKYRSSGPGKSRQTDTQMPAHMHIHLSDMPTMSCTPQASMTKTTNFVLDKIESACRGQNKCWENGLFSL